MLKILFWLLFDAYFIYAFISFWSELGNYIFLFLAVIAFFTFELICAIKNWIGK